MNANIIVDLDAVVAVIDKIREANITEASTAEIIRKYMGGFLSNQGVPAHLSWNAQFGKILSENAKVLRIEQIATDQPVVDDIGHKTSASIWRV